MRCWKRSTRGWRAKAPAWNKLSREKVTELVDWMVIELDPEAVRRAKQRDLGRHIDSCAAAI
jgi:hypothetical protein